MAVLYRGTHRVIVPDGVASDYEADGWSLNPPAPDEIPVEESPAAPEDDG